MVDYTGLAIADCLKHPRLGIISFQGDIFEKIEDLIIVRDSEFRLTQTLASECELASEKERRLYWKKINKKEG